MRFGTYQLPGAAGEHTDPQGAACLGRVFEARQIGVGGLYVNRVECVVCHREMTATEDRLLPDEGTRMSVVEVNSTDVFGGNVCDSCGEKATHAVRNRIQERINAGFGEFSYGPWRFGCDIHKKKRITKYLNGTLEQAA